MKTTTASIEQIVSRAKQLAGSMSHGTACERNEVKLTLVQTRADDGGGKPMFNVCADGVKVGEVYFNMTGFTGYFKLPHLPKTGFNLGEGSLARVKRELREFERDYQPVPVPNEAKLPNVTSK